ncbi:hypothetical protein RB595_008949 [Gaeumannomyces hyphopodioides]
MLICICQAVRSQRRDQNPCLRVVCARRGTFLVGEFTPPGQESRSSLPPQPRSSQSDHDSGLVERLLLSAPANVSAIYCLAGARIHGARTDKLETPVSCPRRATVAFPQVTFITRPQTASRRVSKDAMRDGRPAKRAKRDGATSATPPDPSFPSFTIPIPITNRPPPSHYPTYVPGSGPPSGKIRLQPETDDSTGYIIDKLVLPAGPLLNPTVQRRLYYIVGWPDIPAARIAIDCAKALEYLTPRCIEDWEYEDCLRREREQQEAAFEALRNAPVRKKAGRPPKNRILADADEVQAEEQALRSSQPSASGPSLSSPQKVRATGLISGGVGSGEHYKHIDLDSEGEAVEFYDAEDMAAEDSMDIDEYEEDDDDNMLQKVLLEQAERNARAEELDDDYDELAGGRTIVRLDDAPVSQRLPGRVAKSKLANAFTPRPSMSVAPSLLATAPSTKTKGGGTGRGPGRWPKGTKASDYGGGTSAPSLPPPEVTARIKARRQQREPAVASSSSSATALPPLWFVSSSDDDDDDGEYSAAAPERSPSPEYTGKGKQPVYTCKGKEPIFTDKGKEPTSMDKGKGKESVWPIFQTQVSRPKSVSTVSLSTKNDMSNKALGGTDSAVPSPATEDTPAQTIDGPPLYEVERLEGVKVEKIDGAAVYFFLVRWKGNWTDDMNPSWEPEENLDSRLVRRFLKAHKKAAREESARMMPPPPPPPQIPAPQPTRTADRQVAEPGTVPVVSEAGNGARTPHIPARGIIPQISHFQPPVPNPRQVPTQRRPAGSSSLPIAIRWPRGNEQDFDMEDADGDDAFLDSDKDEVKELRLVGLANGSYQPPMGVHLEKPVLPQAVRDSLPRVLPRSSRK